MERARRNILAGSATEQQRMDTRTAQPVCFEVFIFFFVILKQRSRTSGKQGQEGPVTVNIMQHISSVQTVLLTDQPRAGHPRTSCHISTTQALFGQRPGMRARSKHITSKGPKLLSVKKGITGWMTQLLKYDSVIMRVSNTERRFCFF